MASSAAEPTPPTHAPDPRVIPIDWITLPKAELHLHIEGTLEPESMFELARRNGVRLPYPDVESVRRAYVFGDLQSFLDIYYAACAVLVQERDFYELTLAYLRRALLDGVRHAEIFFDPQTHTARGIDFATVVTGISRALADGRELGISSRLIMCFLRDLPAVEAMAALEQALPHRELITGVGLDSAELGNPPAKFEQVFARAVEHGFHVVAHAGEEGPPDYIRQALDVLGAERIDHGVRCLEDPQLVERLATEQIPLTVCPLSNVKLRVVDRLEHHPLAQMLDSGLCVTVNSDDPAYFGGYVGENFAAVRRALALGDAELVRLARNSFTASFLDEAAKARHLAEIDAHIQPA
ncbi:MAG TPA: adenosine deaminase [Solirubrobacteraceae bacterium]|nr:adenosine deaminase [Solirubrobacteraceae bacterium]